TAFMCMCSGIEPSAKLDGAPYVQQSLQATLGDFGPVFITVAMVLFAFTTLIGNLYYVDQGIFYLKGNVPGKNFRRVYYVIASLLVFVGAGLNAGILWSIADITMGAMAIINIPVIFMLGKYSLRALNNYERQRKHGVDPVFHAADVGLEGKVETWQ
ncbi:MAG: alanine:cation symporter family protein, partial [Clostridia bacterium]|nr:alanine:cation symporter family protein [Clostridia bacterium]